MANVCSNRAVIRHKDPAQLNRLIGAWERGAVCQEFLPVPPSVENKDDWKTCTWGPSIDFGESDSVRPSVQINDGVRFSFQTRNTPPLGLYLELLRQGYEIDALYWEPGVGLCGRVEGSVVRDFDIQSRDIAEIRKHIDAELIKEFAMEEYYAPFEDEDEDESPSVLSHEPWETRFELAHLVPKIAKAYLADIALLDAMERNSRSLNG